MASDFGVEKALPSGAMFMVGKTPFPASHALFKAILKTFKGVSLAGMDWKGFLNQDVSALIGLIVEAATSPEVEAALFKCFERCSWNKQAVTKDLFDDPENGDAARRDLYDMAAECARVNCTPFFADAFSRLKAGAKATAPASPAST